MKEKGQAKRLDINLEKSNRKLKKDSINNKQI